MKEELTERLSAALLKLEPASAKELAAHLGVGKSQVNSTLYSRRDLFKRRSTDPPTWVREVSAAVSARPTKADAGVPAISSKVAKARAESMRIERVLRSRRGSLTNNQEAKLREVAALLDLAEVLSDRPRLKKARRIMASLAGDLTPSRGSVIVSAGNLGRTQARPNGAYGFYRCGHTGRCSCSSTR